MTPDPEPGAADEADDPEGLIRLSGSVPVEVFPFVTLFHREVVLRHKDGESQDIEMTPDEADAVAEKLRIAAAAARAARRDA